MEADEAQPRGPCWVLLNLALNTLERDGALRIAGTRSRVLDTLHKAVMRCSEPIEPATLQIWKVLYRSSWPTAAEANEWLRVELARALVEVATSGTEEHVTELIRSMASKYDHSSEQLPDKIDSLAREVVRQVKRLA
jgi:hypothetical protein